MGFFSRNRGKGANDGSGATTPDFSHITTVALAQAAVERGELEPMHLFPPKFGGETLIRFFQDGTIDKLTVSPEYKGQTVVSAKVVLTASHGTKSGSFNPTIDIW